MKFAPEAKLCSKTGLQQVLFSALLFYVPLYTLNQLAAINPNLEFIFCPFISEVMGFLWGLPAAVGITLATLAYATFYNTDPLFLILVSWSYFLIAYTPFRLWYSLATPKDYLVLVNRHDFLKFIAILIFCGWHFGFMSAAFEAYFLGNYLFNDLCADTAAITIMPLWLSMLLIVLFDNHLQKIYYKPASQPQAWQKYTGAALMALVALELYFAMQLLRQAVTPTCALVTEMGGLFLWTYVIQRPSTYIEEQDSEYNIHTLADKMTFQLFVGSGFIILVFFLSSALYEQDYLKVINGSYYPHNTVLDMSIILVLTTLAIYYFLRYIENYLTLPVCTLSQQLQNYLTTGEITEINAKQIPTENGQENELHLFARALEKTHTHLKNYISVLDQTVAQQQTMQAQMDIAANIQQGVLPDLEALQSQLNGYKISGGMQAAKSVGGDMYDAFLVDNDHLVLCVADVSGKGIPAALCMMLTQALIKENATHLPPAAAIAKANSLLSYRNKQCSFVTMWLAVVELSTGKCTYVNAGHNPPLLKHKDSPEPLWLENFSGLVLGLEGNVTYQSYEFTLKPGDSLLLYTDGLNEAMDKDGNLYGNERLASSFSATQTPEALLKDIQRFARGAEQSDDMTYIWLTREEVAACN